ncbi:unnamed protein product [Symbiodinium sp. CCMP2592]|nr:unnamed protein product [Symbiodinium sp. CCMP2592]
MPYVLRLLRLALWLFPVVGCLDWCTEGRQAGDLCCGRVCESCGPCGSETRKDRNPGGGACCEAYLRRLGRSCHSARDVFCLVPTGHPPRRRGNASCAAAVSASLPLLSGALVVKEPSLSKFELYTKAIHAWHVCTEMLGSAFWEFQLTTSHWPIRRTKFRHRIFTEETLHVFLCAPSPSPYTGVLASSPACVTVEALLKEALPVTLDYTKQLNGALMDQESPKGTAKFVLGGWDRHKEVVEMLVSLKQRAVEHELTRETPKLRAAVCVAGLARSFHLPQVHESIANATRSLKAETQIFYVLDLQGRPLEEFDQGFTALPPDGMVLYDEVRGTGLRMPQCHWAAAKYAHKQFEKFHSCQHIITAAEKAQRRRFDWVLRLRPDFEWLAPIGNLREFTTEKVHIVLHWIHPNKFHDTTDYFALVPRKYMKAYFSVGCPSRRWTRIAALEDLCRGLICNQSDCTAQPECALLLHLRAHQVPVEPFPPIVRILRESTCHPGDLKCLHGWDLKALERYPEQCFLCHLM